MATLMYAPPEVIRADHKKIGFKSDMYSFGVTLYEILCGVPPFNEPDCQKVLDMHLKKKHVPLIGQNPQVDRSVSDLIDKMLSKNPKQRPASWTNVVHNLQAFLNEKAEAKMRLGLFTGIPLAILICGLAVLGFLYYNYDRNKNKKKKIPETEKKTFIIPEPKTQPVSPEKKQIPQPEPVKPVKPAPPDPTHEELEKLLSSISGFSGNIAAASRLRFKVLKLQQDDSLSRVEQTKLAVSIAELEKHLKEARAEAQKHELIDFIAKLKKEKKASAAKQARERNKNLLLAERSKIFKLVASFIALPKEQQTVKTLTRLLAENKHLDRKSKEYKVLTFLMEVLPHKYNREAIIFENLDQITGKKLPWKIDSQEYEITGGSWQSMHLKTKFTEGVFSRKKIRATSLTNAHWCSIVDEFLIKGTIKSTEKNFKNTACWLLLNAQNELFNKFIKKYYPEDSDKWFDCRKLLTAAPAEAAAYNAWLGIEGQFSELNRMLWKSIKDFKSKYGNTQVYGTIKNTLLDYQDTVSGIYLEAVMENLKIKSLSPEDDCAKIFSAWNRYGLLNSVPSETRIFLRGLFNKKLKSLLGDREFEGQFGIFKDVPCGKVYGWLTVPQPAKVPYPHYIPAFLDIDNWIYLKRIIFKKPSQLKSDFAKLKEDYVSYPFILYSTGLAAQRNCEWKVTDMVFSDYNELIAKNDADVSVCALFANLALKSRGNQYVRKILDKYKFKATPETKEIIITLLKIQALLNWNPVNELAVDKLISNARKHFSDTNGLENDLKLLERLRRFVCAELPDSEISPDIFRRTAYPYLHARLWLEAAARDKILQRNSINIPALLNAAVSIQTASVFRSDLFRKTAFLELASKNLTPSELRDKLNDKLLNLKPCASDSYPTLLILLFSAELFDGRLKAEKLSRNAADFVFNCPVFSPAERGFPNILRSPDPLKTLDQCQDFSPPPFQEACLWILAAARAERSGEIEKYTAKLKLLRKNLNWTELLLIDSWMELLENYP
jgi:hypothetical protein